jgi:hypothetical protein
MDPGLYLEMVKHWKASERTKSARSASIACMLANINRRKGASAFTLEDFIGEADE